MSKTKKNIGSLYYKEEKNVDVFTFIIHILGIVISIGTIIYNYNKNLTYSLYCGALILSALVIAMLVYFKFKFYLIGAYISILGTSLGISGVLYLEGRLSFNFLYYFAIVLSIPFLVKRNKNFIRDNNILFAIVTVIAITTIIIAPTYPTYHFLTIEDIYAKMLINSTVSLLSVVMFSIIIIYATRNFIIALLKDKKFAEEEKDKRMVALTSLGHELRTQINSINGVTQLITEQKKETKPDKDLLRKYTTILDKCNGLMLNLVNDVLDVHKIESGKFELIEQPESLDKVLTSVFNAYKNIAIAKELTLKKETCSSIANLNLIFDKVRLTQILRNLLSNAIKYTDVGTITIKTHLIEETTTHASILFKIEDTGIGISKKDHSKIFESFQQVKSESFDIYGGTGLGLSLTKTILDKMNSSIDIESDINEGSIFSFQINFLKTTQKSIAQNIDALLNDLSCLKDKNILIAEDNAVNLLYTDTLLKKHKATTFLAKDGLEAIDAVKNNADIDTILLDIEMPRLNGLEAIKKIKKLNPEQKVIAFTANIPNEDLLKKLYSYGFDDFITKPFKKEELIKTIYFNKRRAK